MFWNLSSILHWVSRILATYTGVGSEKNPSALAQTPEAPFGSNHDKGNNVPSPIHLKNRWRALDFAGRWLVNFPNVVVAQQDLGLSFVKHCEKQSKHFDTTRKEQDSLLLTVTIVCLSVADILFYVVVVSGMELSKERRWQVALLLG